MQLLLLTPRPKKGPGCGLPQTAPKESAKTPEGKSSGQARAMKKGRKGNRRKRNHLRIRILSQRSDEAVKRLYENKAQNKAKIVPKGGVGLSSSMTVIDHDEDDVSVSCSAIQVSEDCYAMVDSGANAIIVLLHPDMYRETADCKVVALKRSVRGAN